MQNGTQYSGLSERLRRRTGSVLVDSFFRGLAGAGRLHPRARPEAHNVEVTHNVPYRQTGLAEHLLDVYRPAGAAPAALLPTVLYVHGGGFRILSKDTHWLMGLAFARRGYVVFNISYRLAPAHPFPAALEDACSALGWVAEHAGSYGGDASRLVLAGESAGANLVTSLAVVTSYPRSEPWARAVWDSGLKPRAVVPACGMLQVSNPERFRQRWPHMKAFINDRLLEVSEAYLEGSTSQASETMDLADPLVLLERGIQPERPLPPFFVPCGTKDPLIDDSQRLAVALEQLGVEHEAKYYPGEVHAFHAMIWRRNARRCWAHTFSFLERQGVEGARAAGRG